jgi:hypothetical protein
MAKRTVADVARATLESLIEERPIEAIIASVLIGVVLGRFFL